MTKLNIKHVRLLKEGLLFINALLVIYNASIFLLSSKYISMNGYSRVFLDRVSYVPTSPQKLFFESLLLFICLVGMMYIREKDYGKELNSWIIYIEIFLSLFIIIRLNGSYNGVLLLVLSDIIYNTKNVKHWPIILITGFGLLLISDYNILSSIISMPNVDSYISFIPSGIQTLVLFFKNIFTSLNVVIFILFLVSYLFVQQSEKQKVSEELALVSQVNTELKNYSALTEKIGEDKERKRISREIHDTLGHALTGISAGVDACIALIDIDKDKAKQQLVVVSDVVREGIKDVRRSLYKLRPGALEDRTLKDGIIKMIEEFQSVSNLQIDFYYEWDDLDFENTKEDIIFRIIQESITNALRHGHASLVEINFMNDQDCLMIIIQDNGIGCKEIKYGYGLKQMSERVAIIDGTINFINNDGFRTVIEIPKIRREHND